MANPESASNDEPMQVRTESQMHKVGSTLCTNGQPRVATCRHFDIEYWLMYLRFDAEV